VEETFAAELRTVLGKLIRRTREHSQLGELTMSQVSVLSRLSREGPATVTALAQAEGMRPQSMGAIVASLQTAGHVVGSPDPRDGRKTLLSLTQACQDWIKARRAAKEDRLDQAIRAKLTPEQQAELVKLLKLIAD
jgi:DNA-binding MarR family transcriptional regulator